LWCWRSSAPCWPDAGQQAGRAHAERRGVRRLLGGQDEGDLLRLVSSAEVDREHPLAVTTIIATTKDRELELAQMTTIDSVTGKGVRATVEGPELLIGNARLLRDADIATGELASHADEGETPMDVALDGRAADLVAVADTIKPRQHRRHPSAP